MLGAGGFFCYAHQSPRGADLPRTYAFAYKPPGPLQAGALDQVILEVCRGPNIPDAVVVLGVKGDTKDELRKQLKTHATKLSRTRIQARIPLLSANFDLTTGSLDLELLDNSFSARTAEFQQDIVNSYNDCLISGLRAVFNPNDVILKAPPGYAYQKPSGARSEIFLKSDLGLKSSANVGFVALCMFARVYAGNTDRFSALQTVYVDTMAVSPVAYALKDLLSLSGFSGAYHIESFHSYGGMEAVPRPLQGSSFCIISASSSMSMHQQWISEKGVGSNEVITLITLTSAKSTHGALLALQAPPDLATPGPVQLSIRIKGETFLPEQEPAKKVLLRDIIHRSDEDVAKFREFIGTGVFDIYRQPARSPATTRALFVDGEQLLKQQTFQQWLGRTLSQSVKAATKAIVHQDDLPSRQLAEQTSEFCNLQLGLSNLKVVSSQQLAELTLEESSGVIACAAVIGKGSQLLEVSRVLREKHKGPRLFVVGFQVTETRGELNTLRANLVHAKGIPHDFQRFGCAAIGTQLKESFDQETRRFYNPSADFTQLPGSMAQRAAVLGQASNIGSLSLLPHGDALSLPLQIRPGFAYWPDGFSAGAYQPEILATVAVLLQRAREHDKLADEHRLWSSTYRHVVLDPENFARFNDGILQAALLRCAYPSELDYRADHAASDFMKGVILRALGRAQEQAGEGFLEFLHALVQRKLQLTDSHRNQVLEAAAVYRGSDALRAGIAFLTEPNLPSRMPF